MCDKKNRKGGRKWKKRLVRKGDLALCLPRNKKKDSKGNEEIFVYPGTRQAWGGTARVLEGSEDDGGDGIGGSEHRNRLYKKSTLHGEGAQDSCSL